jgi:hypothetical protein
MSCDYFAHGNGNAGFFLDRHGIDLPQGNQCILWRGPFENIAAVFEEWAAQWPDLGAAQA